MSRKLSLGGSDSQAKGKAGYYNPLTGGHDAEKPYKQHLDIGRRTCDWLPWGLSLKKFKAGETDGYRRKRPAKGIPGWVWVKKS